MKHNRFSLLIILCSIIAFCISMSVRAEEGETISYSLSKVRLLAKPGSESELLQGRILGSQEGATTAMEVLAVVAETPSEGCWLEVPVSTAKPYRYVKFAAAPDSAVYLAEIEFHSKTGPLSGNPFGSSLPKEKEDVAFPNAFDGNPKTWFVFPDDNAYAGLDLGGKSQAPRPRFVPEEGGYDSAREVKIEIHPAGATIRYTTDGSVPNENSPIYEKPIPVTCNVTLAAKSYHRNLAESDVSLSSYRIGPEAGKANKNSLGTLFFR